MELVSMKDLCIATGISQLEIARDHIGIGQSAFNLVVNQSLWPKKDTDGVKQRTRDFLLKHYTQAEVDAAFEHLKTLRKEVVLRQPSLNKQTPTQAVQPAEDESMLFAKKTLTPQAKSFFRVFTNPFALEVTKAEHLFLGSDFNYVRQALWHAAKTGSFIAITGESGSGKTTLKQDLFDRIDRENMKCVVIEPYIIASADTEAQGKVMKPMGIAEAIIKKLGHGLVKPKRSVQSQFEQVHELLLESSRAGYSHLLLLEEGHSLTVPLLRQLKRLFELKQGYKTLLSIVIIAQPEILNKLSERNYAVREIVQRIEIVKLEPIKTTELTDYLRHCVKQVDLSLEQFIDADGIQAMTQRMQHQDRSGQVTSLLYPLAIGNFMAAAMNSAAQIGTGVITPGIVARI